MNAEGQVGETQVLSAMNYQGPYRRNVYYTDFTIKRLKQATAFRAVLSAATRDWISISKTG